MANLSWTQVETLERIRSIQELQAKQLAEFCRDNPGSYPSPWISVVTLTNTHHLRRATIKALVAKGFLEERPTDGWGPEVKPVFTRPLSTSETMRAERAYREQLEKEGAV